MPALPVVISALIDRNERILLIQRKKGNFVGLWGLPGGKIEENEHLSDAAVREIAEESGIESVFVTHLGTVSEHLVDVNSVEEERAQQHFLLHVCELEPLSTEAVEGCEGKLEWFSLDTLSELKSKIIPSDFPMIEEIVRKRNGRYFNCIIEKDGKLHTLRKFERVN